MRARLFLALRALIAVWCLIGLDPAWAGPPGQFVVLNGGIKPAVYTDLTASGGNLPSWLSYSGVSLRTITDATGAITYAPNNLILQSAAPGTQSVATTAGVNYIVNIASGTGSITLSGAATGTVNAGAYLKVTATTASLTLTVSGSPANVAVSAVTYETAPRPGDQVITQAAAYYGPAFDYDPVTHAPLGLRIEEARTNLTAYSQDFTNAAWTPNDGASKPIVSGTTVSPDGTSNAQLWTAITGASVFQMLYQAHTVSSGQTVTGTAFFKAGTQRYFRIAIDNADAFGNAIGVVFDATLASATTSTVGVGTGATYSITAYPNSWYRVSLSGSITGKTNANMSVGFAGSSSGYFTTYSPSGQTGYVWGAQLEAGSFPTSYIPTAASPVSRAADVVQIVGPALAAYRAPNIAVIGEVSAPQAPGGNTAVTSGSAIPTLAFGASYVKAGFPGVVDVATQALTFTANSTYRFGASFKSGEFYVTANGNAPTKSTNVQTWAAPVAVSVGVENTVINGYVRKLAIYNRALTGSQLQARTVLGAPF